MRAQFAQQGAHGLAGELSATELERVVHAHAGAYRDRLYPPLRTLSLFMDQALSADAACQDAVARHLSERTASGEALCSLNTGPYCKARARLPIGLVHELQRTLGQRLERAQPRYWRWRGRSVKLLDGTTVSMPDTRANQAQYPQSGTQKPGLGFPIAQVVALISMGTGAVLDWAIGPCRGKGTGEQALFRQLHPSLERGDVLIADRYYCTYWTLAALQARGVEVITRQHARRLHDFRCGRRLGRHDHEVYWERPKCPRWMDEATYAQVPERLRVRETRIGGRVLVSTVLDAHHVPAQEIDALYRGRWQIELDLRAIKAVMGMDILRCKSPEMVRKEIAVYLLAYNLVRAVMAKAAALAGVLARALSFKGTLRVLGAYHEQLRRVGRRRRRIMLAHMLGAISTLRLPDRPGRVEPRAIKRRPKPHPLLLVPRSLARLRLLLPRYAKVVP